MAETGFAPQWFSRPGVTVARLMDARGYTVADVATKTGRDQNYVRGLLSGATSIDEPIAVELSGVLGGSAAFWMTRQRQYEQSLLNAAGAVGRDDASAWIASLPTKQMREEGWISPSKNQTETTKELLSFFDVASPDEWRERYAAFANSFAFRTSPTFASKIGGLAAWLRRGEIEAQAQSCKPFDRPALRDALPELRALTRSKTPKKFIPRLREVCAECGVAVVFVKAPSGCRASGASRFLAPEKAMIILSFRYLSDDHFWFTVFHEAGHLLLHDPGETFIDGEDSDLDPREDEANNFSGGVLVPFDRFEEMLELPNRADALIRFAVSVGTSPGVIAGQMQYHRRLGPNQFNGLKRRYTWDEISAAAATQ